MSKSKDKDELKKLLEDKCNLFGSMEEILTEQKELLENGNFNSFQNKSGQVDKVIEKVKNIDYDIARLESSYDDFSNYVTGNDNAPEIKKILINAFHSVKNSHDLLIELVKTLSESRNAIKDELGDTVAMSSISGYKPAVAPSPVYLDETS